MNFAGRVFSVSVAGLSFLAVLHSEAAAADSAVSSVTTLEAFQKAKALGDQAASFEDKARYWRDALTWPGSHVEWLHLAWSFAANLKDEWHNTGVNGQPPQLDHPYYTQAESIYREILKRFDHMTFYKPKGADNLPDDSLLVPAAASIGLQDFPRFLSMMQDFNDRRVADWLAEPAPTKQTDLAELSFRQTPQQERVAAWLNRRIDASEGRVFSSFEQLMIDSAVKQYAYDIRGENGDGKSADGLAELATHYTAPAITTAVQKYLAIESPPPAQPALAVNKVIERNIQSSFVSNNNFVGASKVDFDTGNVVTNELQWASGKQQSGWMKCGGLDLEVDYHWDDLMWVVGFDLELVEVPASSWEQTPDSWDQLQALEVKNGGLRTADRGAGQTQYMIAANTRLPATFCFRTREGGVGLLQLTEMRQLSPKRREYSIRFRVIRQRTPPDAL